MTAPAAVGSVGPVEGRRPLAARIAIGLIRAYQAARFGHVSPCRFTPTCSEYAAQALDRHGLRRGLGLTLRRLGRCRPFGPYGADPVPPLQAEPVAPLESATTSAPVGRTPTPASCGAHIHPTPAGRPRPGMRS